MSDLWRVVDDLERLETDVQNYIWKAREAHDETRMYHLRFKAKGRMAAYRTILKRIERILKRKPSATG